MADLQRDLFRNPEFLLVSGLTCAAPQCDGLPTGDTVQKDLSDHTAVDARAPRPRLHVVAGPELPIVPHSRPKRLQQGFIGDMSAAHALQISVVTACQDNVCTVGACLASVQAQNHPKVEHVVVDLDSADGSLKRIMRDRHQLTIVFGRRRDSLFTAWNRGICHTNGEVVCFLNATDIYPDPAVLSRVAKVFAETDVSAVYGNVRHRPSDVHLKVRASKPVGAPSPHRLQQGWAPALDTLFVRRQWLDQVRALATELPLAADFDAVQRLFALPGFRAVYLDMDVVSKPALPSPWRTPWLHWRHTMERLACLHRLEGGFAIRHPVRTMQRLFYMLRKTPPVTGLRS